MTINDIAQRAHAHAKKINAYDGGAGLAISGKLREEVDEYDEAFMKHGTTPSESFMDGSLGDFCHSIVIERSLNDTEPIKKSVAWFENEIKPTAACELADIAITALSSLVELGYNPGELLRAKMTYNEVREDH